VKEEAQKLVAWLTAPEQQAHIFKEIGNIPSSQKALDTDEVKGATSEYFSDAPIGQIFGAAAQEIPDKQVLGRKDGTIKDTFSQGLPLIEQKDTRRDGAGKTTAERIGKAVGCPASPLGRPGPSALRRRARGRGPGSRIRTQEGKTVGHLHHQGPG